MNKTATKLALLGRGWVDKRVKESGLSGVVLVLVLLTVNAAFRLLWQATCCCRTMGVRG